MAKSASKMVHESKHFTVEAEEGYVNSRFWGHDDFGEIREAALKTIEYMEKNDVHQLLLELDQMLWINDPIEKISLIELAGMSKHVLNRVAFVAPTRLIRYMATTIAIDGGIRHVAGFDNLEKARKWLAKG